MNPAINIVAPGFWHIENGFTGRGVAWATAIVFTTPLVLPAIVLWILCLVDACRLDAAARR